MFQHSPMRPQHPNAYNLRDLCPYLCNFSLPQHHLFLALPPNCHWCNRMHHLQCDQIGWNLATFYLNMGNSSKHVFFWFKRVLSRGPEQRESKLTVLCPLIIIILISYIIYYIIIKLLIMENHPSRNWKQNFTWFVLNHLVVVGWRCFELSIFSFFGQISKNWASYFSIFWSLWSFVTWMKVMVPI